MFNKVVVDKDSPIFEPKPNKISLNGIYFCSTWIFTSVLVYLCDYYYIIVRYNGGSTVYSIQIFLAKHQKMGVRPTNAYTHTRGAHWRKSQNL